MNLVALLRRISVSTGALVLALSSPGPTLATYSYGGIHWSGTSTDYFLSGAMPAAWQTAIATSATTWTNDASRFVFNRTFTSQDHFIWRQDDGNNGKLGSTLTSWNNETLLLIDADTKFNTHYAWSTTGEAGKYDVQNAATHELGHWLKLGDVYMNDPNHPENQFETMYAYADPGEIIKRTLDGGDKAGIRFIYGT